MTDFTYLKMAEMRMNSLMQYHPFSAELKRVTGIVESMISDLNTEQKDEYEKSKIQIESAEDKSKRLRAEIKQMELTRDSNSI